MNIRSIALSCIAAGFLVGCGGSGGGTLGQDSPRVRVFNAVDNQSTIALTFVSNGSAIGTSPNAAFGQTNAAADLILNAGNSQAVITTQTGGSLFTGPSSLYRVNSAYTVVAAGNSTAYATIVMQDTQSSTDNTHFAMRLANGAQAAGALDFYVLPAGQSAPGSSDVPTFSKVTFGTSTNTTNNGAVDGNGYLILSLQSGVSVNVVATSNGSKTPLITIPVTITPGTYYTAVAYDGTGGTAVAVLTDKH